MYPYTKIITYKETFLEEEVQGFGDLESRPMYQLLLCDLGKVLLPIRPPIFQMKKLDKIHVSQNMLYRILILRYHIHTIERGEATLSNKFGKWGVKQNKSVS